MSTFLLITAVVAIPSVCALLAWVAYLLLVKHVFDTHGPSAVKSAIPPAARAFPRLRPAALPWGRARPVIDQVQQPGEPPAT